MQNHYDKLVEQCCLRAIKTEEHAMFLSSIVDDVLYRRPQLIGVISRHRLGTHCRICLGCFKSNKTFVANKYRPEDVVDHLDVSNLLSLIRNDY